jgi:thiol:disulfide interchange protein
METFRKVMAVPMGLTALALVWLCWRIGGPWFAAGAIGLALMVAIVLTSLWRPRKPARLIAGFAALFALLATIALPRAIAAPSEAGVEGVVPAQPFSEAALAEARAAGNPVFVWFTADWCLTCKVNERVAIEREATRDAFESAGVVALVGDWTRRDPAITRFLSAHGAAGVPLYLWYSPGGEAEVMPQVLTPSDLVKRAEGSAAR